MHYITIKQRSDKNERQMSKGEAQGSGHVAADKAEHEEATRGSIETPINGLCGLVAPAAVRPPFLRSCSSGLVGFNSSDRPAVDLSFAILEQFYSHALHHLTPAQPCSY